MSPVEDLDSVAKSLIVVAVAENTPRSEHIYCQRRIWPMKYLKVDLSDYKNKIWL